MRIFNFFLLFNVLLISFSAYGQSKEESYRMEQPYFRISNDGKNSENLPLKETVVRTKIAGVIADVTIVQTYQNKSNKPIEATYVFPLSDKAAVYSMEMCVGSRRITDQKAALAPHLAYIQIVGEAAGGAEAIELIHQKQHELLFLDIQLMDMTNFDVLSQFTPTSSSLPPWTTTSCTPLKFYPTTTNKSATPRPMTNT